MIVPSLNFKFLIKQKRKFKWVSLSFFSQTGTYSLTALVYHDESLQGIKKLYTYGITAQLCLRPSPNLLPHPCSYKRGKYIQYSRPFITFV